MVVHEFARIKRGRMQRMVCLMSQIGLKLITIIFCFFYFTIDFQKTVHYIQTIVYD